MPAEAVISDATIKAPSRLLAEALRVKLGASPADQLAGTPAGTLTVQRAYLPVFRLEDTGLTVVTLVPQEQTGEIITREYRTRRSVSVFVSVQRKLSVDATSLQGTAELDEMMEYSERVLRACLTRITDQNGMPFAPTNFDTTEHDAEILAGWNQFAQVHSIQYETIT